MIGSSHENISQFAVGLRQIGRAGSARGRECSPEHARPNHQGDNSKARSRQNATLARLKGLLVEGSWSSQPKRVTGGREGKAAFHCAKVSHPAEREHERDRLRVVRQVSHMMCGVASHDSIERAVGAGGSTKPSVEPDRQSGGAGELEHPTSLRRVGSPDMLVASRSASAWDLSGPAPIDRANPREQMKAVLELAGVSVVRGTNRLLDDIDWTVLENERWVILGPNGAGKTTLLQLVAAQIHPTTGVAGILGEVLGTVDVFDLRPRIGLTSAALADRIPAAERVRNVVVTASYAMIGRWRESYDDLDHERAAALLAEVGVAHLSDRRFGTLSEGERKRVQIARALMADPELLLLDEPAAGLDLGGRETLVNTLSVLANDKASPATVLVSHHVEEVPPGFTHVLLLRGGRVVAQGRIEDTLNESALSQTFGIGLVMEHADGRWTARSRSGSHRLG